jgi:protein gp37
MADKSGIEWTDATWNPVTGCTEVSPGCDHCYAKTFAERWRGTPGHYFENGFDVQLRPDKLDLPLRWRKPRRIFVNSMSDLFHEAVSDLYIAQVFAVMAYAYHHTFQILTKRHGRMRSLLSSDRFVKLFDAEFCRIPDWNDHYPELDFAPAGHISHLTDGPLSNVWLGVSTEDQYWADIRIPALLNTPAEVRFISAEPLLGPIDLTHMDVERHSKNMYWINALTGRNTDMGRPCADVASLDWVIVGGESGGGARPMQTSWARSLRDQCTNAKVPFLFKQWGEYGIQGWRVGQHDGAIVRMGKKNAGRELDGRTWDEYPALTC